MRNLSADKAYRLNVTRFQFLQQLASSRYFKYVVGGMSKIEAANKIAESIYLKSSEGSYKSKFISRWASASMDLGHFPDSKKGKHRGIFPIIKDENVQERFRFHLRGLSALKCNPANFAVDLNTFLLPKFLGI